jgi:hypothetical protein
MGQRSFCRDRARRARFVQKTENRYFSVHTEQARLIKSLLYGIYRHLYSKQTRNPGFEMHISSVVHIWSKNPKNIQKYRCIPSFPLKTIRRVSFASISFAVLF